MENAENMKHNMLKKLPKKTIAIFEAVLELKNKGTDLTSLTVAEIAKQAGIGKGTIYDYFSSKEEIIVKALAYEYCLQVYEFNHSVRNEVEFEKQIDTAFHWVEDNMQRSFFFMRLIKIEENLMKIGKDFCEELIPNIATPDAFNDTIDYVLETGAKEGKIRYPKDELERDMIVNALGGALFVYFMSPERYKTLNYEDVKENAKLFLVRLLQKD